MVEMSPSFARILKVWWLIIWRGMIVGMLGGGLAGFLIGVFSGMIGLSLELAYLGSMFMGVVAGLAASLWAVWSLFDKSFSNFRVALVHLDESSSSSA